MIMPVPASRIFLLLILVFGVREARGQQWDAFVEEMRLGVSYLREKARGHLEIGTRIVHFGIKKDTGGGFLGTIDKLDAKQNYDPTRIFAAWKGGTVERFPWGVELTWERLAVNTITSSTGQNDGTLELSGPVLTVFARWPTPSRFTPFAGVGAVYFNRTHVTKGWWHHGFYDAEDWREADREYYWWRATGAEPWPNEGVTRTFDLEESWGWVFTAGCAAALIPNLEAELYFRYTGVDVDNTYSLAFYGVPVDVRHNTFDLSNYAWGVGARYRFS
jgi:opacity protein-like surface antigen